MAKSKKSKKKVANNFDRDDLGNIIGNKNLEGRDLQKFVLTNPSTGEEYEFDAGALDGADWTGMSQNADNTFTPEEIEKYYDKAMDMKLNEANDFPDGLGDEIKNDWIQEIWDKINPGVKILSHYLATSSDYDLPSASGFDNDWNGNQYTTVVYLTPDMKPEDGGSLELWTPNLTDEMKEMASNTPYAIDAENENNPDVIKSYWPRPGRYVVFESRIPNIARPVESDKVRVALVFKGTFNTLEVEKDNSNPFHFEEVE